MAFPYLEAVIGLKIMVFIFEIYLDIRQYAALNVPDLPKPLEGGVRQLCFQLCQSYSLEEREMCIGHKTLKLLTEMTLLYFGTLPLIWEVSDFNMENGIIDEIIQSLGFILISTFFFENNDLPYLAYWTYVVKGIRGGIKTTRQFCNSSYVELGCHSLQTRLSIFVVIVIVRCGGPLLAFYFWVLIFFLSLLKMMVHSIIVAPGGGKFSLLHGGALRVKIENLASSIKLPLKQIFVLSDSSETDHCKPQVYIHGTLNYKQIFVSSKLIEQFQGGNEVAAAIAHAMGHWKLNHAIYSFLAYHLFIFLQFGGYMLLLYSSGDILQSFGFETCPIIVEVIILELIAVPLQKLGIFAVNLIIHLFEFQADAFAVKLGYAKALQGYLIKSEFKLEEDLLWLMYIDPWYSAFHMSEPKFVQRLLAIEDDYDAQKTD